MSRKPGVWLIEGYDKESESWYSCFWEVYYLKEDALMAAKAKRDRRDGWRYRVRRYVREEK